MSARKPAESTQDAAGVADEIDTINTNLSQARATIDLVMIAACGTGSQDESRIEDLLFGTLNTALYGTRRQIEEALKAADALYHRFYALKKSTEAREVARIATGQEVLQ